jgi:hypothetical protein
MNETDAALMAVAKREKAKRDFEQLQLMVNYTPEQRSQALTMFLTDGLEPAAIALQLCLPIAVIQYFAREDKWLEHRKEIETELVEATLSQERQLILKHRINVRKRHIETAEKLEKRAEDMALDPKTTDSAHKFKSAVEAFAQAAGISAKAVGMEDAKGNSTQSGPPASITFAPVIMVGAQPRAPQLRSVIDIGAQPRAPLSPVIEVPDDGETLVRRPQGIPVPVDAAEAPGAAGSDPATPGPGVPEVRRDGEPGV